jgi:CheY-like chemotaxis protein
MACAERIVGVTAIFIFDLEESERGEWERLLTLAAGLYSVRLTMTRLLAPPVSDAAGGSALATASVINELSNRLSAVIGIAELGARGPDISGDVREQFKGIMVEAESAAEYARRTLAESSARRSREASAVSSSTDLNNIVRAAVADRHVSGNLYMTGNRPREINLDLGLVAPLIFSSDEIRNLFQSALNRFGSMADDEDIISVITYQRGDYVYLDVSRHRRNFPPVEQVAGFGRYQPSDEALKNRPSDVFLRHVAGGACYYAADRVSPAPAYLSFKFPIRREAGMAATSGPTGDRPVRVLAVDDHAVILDLISAMGQSLGYHVDTALRGEEGVRLAEENTYDVVLTDLAMPDISGLEVARLIRARHQQTPVILVTGWEANLEPEQLKAAGISQVLYKPFRIEQLTDIVRAAVGSRV